MALDRKSAASIERWLVAELARRCKISAADIDPTAPIADLGLDSAASLELTGALEDAFDVELSATAAYDHPSIERLAAFIATLA